MATLKISLCDDCFARAIASGAAHGAKMFSDVWDSDPEVTIKGNIITLRGINHAQKRTVTIRVKVHSATKPIRKPKLVKLKTA